MTGRPPVINASSSKGARQPTPLSAAHTSSADSRAWPPAASQRSQRPPVSPRRPSRMLQPRAVLRQLLRALDAHVTRFAGNRQWRDHVLASFRANAGLTDVQQQQALLLLAAEYAELIANIAHYQELLVTYNIGVDSDERNKRMVEATAARVGFKLPQQQQEQHEQQQAAEREQRQEKGQAASS